MGYAHQEDRILETKVETRGLYEIVSQLDSCKKRGIPVNVTLGYKGESTRIRIGSELTVDCFLGDGFPPQLEEHGFAPTYLVITVSSIITGFPPQLEEQGSLLRSS
jgi:hypothetical protein